MIATRARKVREERGQGTERIARGGGGMWQILQGCEEAPAGGSPPRGDGGEVRGWEADRCGSLLDVRGRGRARLVDEVVLVLAGELLERLALGLRDQVRREEPGEHEQREDLEEVLEGGSQNKGREEGQAQSRRGEEASGGAP